MVDIIQRNLLRLIRCGVFDLPEEIEPMSEWKWQQLFQLAQIHGVTPWVGDGLLKKKDDFFVNLSPALRQKFYDDDTERTEKGESPRLTHPRLNSRLQQISREVHDNDATYAMLQDLIAISSNILTHGVSLRQLIMLGLKLKSNSTTINYDLLKEWIDRLGMTTMAALEGALLMELLHLAAADIPFTEAKTSKKTADAVADIFRLTQKNATDWYFTQGESIFVRSSNSNAMLWYMRQAVKYMPYYPIEGIASLIANFAHSLTHIEE